MPEAEAEAAKLFRPIVKELIKVTPAEAEFAKLGAHSVDDQLAALKAERTKGAVSPPYVPKEIAAPGSSISTKSGAGEKTSACGRQR